MTIKPWPANTTCPEPGYVEFAKALSSASYHFADDSGTEWSKGTEQLNLAAGIIIKHRWPYWAIDRMVNEIKPLMSISEVMNSLLNKLYGELK